MRDGVVVRVVFCGSTGCSREIALQYSVKSRGSETGLRKLELAEMACLKVVIRVFVWERG